MSPWGIYLWSGAVLAGWWLLVQLALNYGQSKGWLARLMRRAR